jgi:nitrate/TMAO reductase-like tetraheme cytochrome c subunit
MGPVAGAGKERIVAAESNQSGKRGLWQRLTTPSATWSVLALVIVGLIIGAGGVIFTQVMVVQTGTNEFCGGACHSMQWVAQEYRQSVHFANRTGVQAGCHDCHIPHAYPQLLWYKAKAGIKDAMGEARGVISTKEKFEKERPRLAQNVWNEFKETNSANCQHCHAFSAEVIAKQKEFAQPMHKMVLEKQGTCIDCHKGVAHTAPPG